MLTMSDVGIFVNLKDGTCDYKHKGYGLRYSMKYSSFIATALENEAKYVTQV